MQAHHTCRFCAINNGEFSYGELDYPVAVNNLFYVIPSVGALIEGWTLIVPRIHVYSMKSLLMNEQFREIMDDTIHAMRKVYDKILIFEHGATKEGSLTSCGTEHAHLHLVPFEGSLYEDINNSDLEWTACSMNNILDLSMESEYLFYAEINPDDNWNNQIGLLHVLNKPISQFFRKIIARRCALEQQSDYKQYPFINIATKTRNQLVKHF